MEFNILDQIHNFNRAQQRALLAELSNDDEEYAYDENYIKNFDRKWAESAELNPEDIPYNEVGDRPYFNKYQYEFTPNVEDSFEEPVTSDLNAEAKEAIGKLYQSKSDGMNNQEEDKNFEDLYQSSMNDEDEKYDLNSYLKKEEKELKKVQDIIQMQNQEPVVDERDHSKETYLNDLMLYKFGELLKLLTVIYRPYLYENKITYISRKMQAQMEDYMDAWAKDSLKIIKVHNTKDELLEICRSNNINEKVLSN